MLILIQRDLLRIRDKNKMYLNNSLIYESFIFAERKTSCILQGSFDNN